jgi:hypothetical protein
MRCEMGMIAPPLQSVVDCLVVPLPDVADGLTSSILHRAERDVDKILIRATPHDGGSDEG